MADGVRPITGRVQVAAQSITPEAADARPVKAADKAPPSLAARAQALFTDRMQPAAVDTSAKATAAAATHQQAYEGAFRVLCEQATAASAAAQPDAREQVRRGILDQATAVAGEILFENAALHRGIFDEFAAVREALAHPEPGDPDTDAGVLRALNQYLNALQQWLHDETSQAADEVLFDRLQPYEYEYWQTTPPASHGEMAMAVHQAGLDDLYKRAHAKLRELTACTASGAGTDEAGEPQRAWDGIRGRLAKSLPAPLVDLLLPPASLTQWTAYGDYLALHATYMRALRVRTEQRAQTITQQSVRCQRMAQLVVASSGILQAEAERAAAGKPPPAPLTPPEAPSIAATKLEAYLSAPMTALDEDLLRAHRDKRLNLPLRETLATSLRSVAAAYTGAGEGILGAVGAGIDAILDAMDRHQADQPDDETFVQYVLKTHAPVSDTPEAAWVAGNPLEALLAPGVLEELLGETSSTTGAPTGGKASWVREAMSWLQLIYKDSLFYRHAHAQLLIFTLVLALVASFSAPTKDALSSAFGGRTVNGSFVGKSDLIVGGIRPWERTDATGPYFLPGNGQVYAAANYTVYGPLADLQGAGDAHLPWVLVGFSTGPPQGDNKNVLQLAPIVASNVSNHLHLAMKATQLSLTAVAFPVVQQCSEWAVDLVHLSDRSLPDALPLLSQVHPVLLSVRSRFFDVTEAAFEAAGGREAHMYTRTVFERLEELGLLEKASDTTDGDSGADGDLVKARVKLHTPSWWGAVTGFGGFLLPFVISPSTYLLVPILLKAFPKSKRLLQPLGSLAERYSARGQLRTEFLKGLPRGVRLTVESALRTVFFLSCIIPGNSGPVHARCTKYR